MPSARDLPLLFPPVPGFDPRIRNWPHPPPPRPAACSFHSVSADLTELFITRVGSSSPTTSAAAPTLRVSFACRLPPLFLSLCSSRTMHFVWKGGPPDPAVFFPLPLPA